MSSVEIYQTIRDEHRDAVRLGQLNYDLEGKRDRDNGDRGFVLQVAASALFSGYGALIKRFQTILPEQYYVPATDIHITVFEFVSARSDFSKYEKNIEIYQEVCGEVLHTVKPFPITLRGTVFTRTSGIVSGYDNQQMTQIRSTIRTLLARRGVEPLERYHSRTAHISFIGFRTPIPNYSEFLELVETTQDQFFETVVVKKLELVEHDFYNSLKSKRVISEFKLAGIN